jgi:peptidoglycan biosynthesis protein MviN/MurJ (putative lipid II flippase)
VALANTVATTLESALLLGLLARRLEGMEVHRWGRSVGPVAIATLAMGLVLWPMAPWAAHHGWLGLALAGLAGAGAYGLTLHGLGVPWVRWLRHWRARSAHKA